MPSSILVIAPYIPVHDRAAGGLRLYHALKYLAGQRRVVFLGPPEQGLSRSVEALEPLNIPVGSIDPDMSVHLASGEDAPGHTTLSALLDEYRFEMALFVRYDTAALYLDAVETQLPDCLTLIDADELVFDHMLQEARKSGNPAQLWMSELQRRRELSVYNRADTVTVSSVADQERLSRYVERKDIRVLPHLQPISSNRGSSNPADPKFFETWYGMEAIERQIDQLFIHAPEKTGSRSPVFRIDSPYDAPPDEPWYRPEPDHAHIHPNLTIVIPVFNGLRYTRECVQMIRENTRVPYDIILVDNGSTDGTSEWAEKECLLTIRNEENRGFGYACNQGILASRSAHVVLLNNDALVSRGWVERLMAHLKDDRSIGLVAPSTNYAGSAQQIQAEYTDVESFLQFAEGIYKKNHGKREEVDHLIGMCLVMSRRLIMEVGCFDPRFGVGNYEDNDLGARVRMAGYKMVIARDVFVHHHGSRTFIENKIDYDRVMTENRALFEKKWGSVRAPKPVIKPAAVSAAVAEPSSASIDAPPETMTETPGNDTVTTDAVPQPFEEVVDALPESLQAGYALQSEGRFEEAAEQFALAAEALPEAAEPRLAYGIAQFSLGNTDRAVQAFEEAARLDPDTPEPYNSLGCIAFQQGDFEEATRHFTEALKRDGSHLMALKNMADIRMQQSDYWTAIELLEQTLAQDPTDVEAFLSIGNCYFRLEGFESAIMAYEQALKIDPENQDALANIEAVKEEQSFQNYVGIEIGYGIENQ